MDRRYTYIRKFVMEATLEQQKTATSPKLTCLITGKVRPTNENYLAKKAESRGVSVEQFAQHYTCKQAVKRLRAGMSVEQARQELGSDVTTPISPETVKVILRLNGKAKRQ
jgi:hypothetical protein